MASSTRRGVLLHTASMTRIASTTFSLPRLYKFDLALSITNKQRKRAILISYTRLGKNCPRTIRNLTNFSRSYQPLPTRFPEDLKMLHLAVWFAKLRRIECSCPPVHTQTKKGLKNFFITGLIMEGENSSCVGYSLVSPVILTFIMYISRFSRDKRRQDQIFTRMTHRKCEC